tara:strand:+ start:35816 stop:37615 length:1800 start_codon:yes stop_codon:yes gene_type:complete
MPNLNNRSSFWQNLVAPFSVDLRTLALFRVCFGFILIGDLVTRASALSAHYTDDGLWPREAAAAAMQEFGFSIHLLGGSAAFQVCLFLLAGLLAVLLIVGYRTQLVSVLCWLMLASLNHRNYFILQSSDTLMLALLFWSLLLPLGARWSVDAALDPHPPQQASICNFASAALVLQVLSVYFFGALLKTGDAWRVTGDAVHVTLHYSSYASPLGVWLAEWLPAEALRGLTWYTWYIELWGPILVLLPWCYQHIRFVIVPALILLHLGIASLVEVGIYPYLSITSLLLLVPTRFWDLLKARVATPERLGVTSYYDANCEFCRKICLLLRTFWLLNSTPIKPAQEHHEIGPLLEAENSWVVVDHDGQRYLRWAGMLVLLRRSWLLWPVAGLFHWPPLRTIGECCYAWVANHRESLGRITAVLLPCRSPPFRLSLVPNLTMGFLMVLVLWLNIAKLRDVEIDYPWSFTRLTSALLLNQYWTMFAPEPGRISHWLFVDGELAGGRRVDAVALRFTPSDLATPEDGSGYFDGFRWRKYFSEGRIEPRWPYLSAYYCRRWNRLHPDQPIQRVFGYLLVERTRIGIYAGEAQWQRKVRSLGAANCPA